MTKTSLRAALRRAFGDRHYKITANGNIIVFGSIPNSNQTGWWLFGEVGNHATERRVAEL